MNDRRTRRLLEDWDPAAGVETPTRELSARIRAGLTITRKPAGRLDGASLSGRWVAAAAALAGALVFGIALARLESPRAQSAERPIVALETAGEEPESVQVVYTASNGVRIYWTVPATDSSRM